jgi:hypothetical protein
MPYLIEFTAGQLDVDAEPENPVNPIAGHSFLKWLAPRLEDHGIALPEPEAEDWGWSCDVSAFENGYLLGVSAEKEDVAPGAPADWIVQIHKRRRLKERLLGRNQLGDDDRFCRLVEQLVRAEPAFREVSARLEG